MEHETRGMKRLACTICFCVASSTVTLPTPMKRRWFICILVLAACLVAGVFVGNRMSESSSDDSATFQAAAQIPVAAQVREPKRVVLPKTNFVEHTNAVEAAVTNREDLVAVPLPREKLRFIPEAWKRYPASTNVSEIENINRHRA